MLRLRSQITLRASGLRHFSQEKKESLQAGNPSFVSFQFQSLICVHGTTKRSVAVCVVESVLLPFLRASQGSIGGAYDAHFIILLPPHVTVDQFPPDFPGSHPLSSALLDLAKNAKLQAKVSICSTAQGEPP